MGTRFKEDVHEQQQIDRAFSWGDERAHQAMQEVCLWAYCPTEWDADINEHKQSEVIKGTALENSKEAVRKAVLYLIEKRCLKRQEGSQIALIECHRAAFQPTNEEIQKIVGTKI